MRPSDAPSPSGDLMRLAVQASSIVGGMVIPGLIGGYLDSQLGTQFCVLIGLGLGVVLGTMQLLYLARGSKPRGSGQQAVDEDDEDPDRDAGA